MLKGGKQPYNLLLSPSEHAALQWLAANQSISAAAVLRRALGAAVQHARACPTCANGQRCFVPQMHQQQQPIAPPPNLLDGFPVPPASSLPTTPQNPFAAFEPGGKL